MMKNNDNDHSGTRLTADAAVSVSASEAASHVAHTPGPWEFDGNDRWAIQLPFPPAASKTVGRRLNGREILVEGWSAQEAIANAHLIAVAPELLAALKAMVASYDGLRDALTCKTVIAKLAAADAAIAKAEAHS